VLLLQDIQRRKNTPDPYEMLRLGGQWNGNYKLSVRDGLRLEIFTNAPKRIVEHAHTNLISVAYRDYVPEYVSDNDNPRDNYIIHESSVIGYYSIIFYPKHGLCWVDVNNDTQKMSLDVAYRELQQIQNICKARSDITTIYVFMNLPDHIKPTTMPGLEVHNRSFLCYRFKYDLDTLLPQGAPTEPLGGFSKNEQERLEKQYKKLKMAFESISNIIFALRDEDNAFLGLLILQAHPNLSNLGFVDILYIAPQLRGTGFGKALLSLAEQCLIKANVNNVMLFTASYMVPEFYKKHGYTITGSSPGEEGIYYVFHKALPKPTGELGETPKPRSPLKLLMC